MTAPARGVTPRGPSQALFYEFVLAAHHADFTARHELLHGSGPVPWGHIQLQQNSYSLARGCFAPYFAFINAHHVCIRQADLFLIRGNIHMGTCAQPGQLAGIKQSFLAILSERSQGK